jgi:hypothetical protein
MSNIVMNVERHGNFTSSEIVDLTKEGKVKGTWGKPALTYIEEKNMERKLGMCISSDTEARPTCWGTFGERMVEMLLGEYYEFSPSVSMLHPTISNWSGSRDAIKYDEGKTVAEVKCPYTRKAFCQLVQPIYDELEGIDAINAIRFGYIDKNGLEHAQYSEAEKYYWQIISNACISGCKYGELIVYMPYESEIPAIQHAAEKAITEGESQFYFIASSKPEQLPYIKDGGYYSNLNIIRFAIPEADKEKLEQLVVKASELLIKI